MSQVIQFPTPAPPDDTLRTVSSLGVIIGDALSQHNDATRALLLHALTQVIKDRIDLNLNGDHHAN